MLAGNKAKNSFLQSMGGINLKSTSNSTANTETRNSSKQSKIM